VCYTNAKPLRVVLTTLYGVCLNVLDCLNLLDQCWIVWICLISVEVDHIIAWIYLTSAALHNFPGPCWIRWFFMGTVGLHFMSLLGQCWIASICHLFLASTKVVARHVNDMPCKQDTGLATSQNSNDYLRLLLHYVWDLAAQQRPYRQIVKSQRVIWRSWSTFNCSTPCYYTPQGRAETRNIRNSKQVNPTKTRESVWCRWSCQIVTEKN